jgi:hypothetical protein
MTPVSFDLSCHLQNVPVNPKLPKWLFIQGLWTPCESCHHPKVGRFLLYNDDLYFPRRFDVVVVSPRNFFFFTPMLPSTAVGTVEFRSLLEPIRTSNEVGTSWPSKILQPMKAPTVYFAPPLITAVSFAPTLTACQFRG